MIILRAKSFSNKVMINRITDKLDRDGIQDYEVSSRIPKDVASITSDLGNIKINLPLDFEYNQYDIDNFIRGNFGSQVRTTTKQDRDIYVMTLSTKINENQFYKLVKYIIELTEFITILDNN